MPKNRNNSIFFIILVIYLCYGILFIWRTSFVIGGERYFCLFDDAMISMRYGYNLAHGYGLVWNPGESPVEGYSNPLWTIIMSGFHFLPIAASKISLFVQLLSLIFLGLTLCYIRKISGYLTNEHTNPVVISIILVGTYLPINYWGLMGMETALLGFLITGTYWLTLKNLTNQKISVWQFILPGLCILTRMDCFLISITYFSLIYYYYSEQRKKVLFYSLITLLICIGGTSLFRILYYHDIFPNTYYLKMTGYPVFTRIIRGLFAFLKFVYYFNPILFLMPFVYIFIKKSKGLNILFLIILVQLLYSIYVGGDAWEYREGSNRFITIIMPLLLMLLGISLVKIFKVLGDFIRTKYGIPEKHIKNFIGLIIVLLVINLNSFKSNYSLGEFLLTGRIFKIYDNEINTRLGLIINKYTKEEARVGVVTAGATPYFMQRTAIDFLGKNDKYIAREQMHVPNGFDKFIEFTPGHTKWDYSYSIGKLKPDIVIQLWNEPETAKPYLDNDYILKNLDGYLFYIRKDSHNIKWELIN